MGGAWQTKVAKMALSNGGMSWGRSQQPDLWRHAQWTPDQCALRCTNCSLRRNCIEAELQRKNGPAPPTRYRHRSVYLINIRYQASCWPISRARLALAQASGPRDDAWHLPTNQMQQLDVFAKGSGLHPLLLLFILLFLLFVVVV